MASVHEPLVNEVKETFGRVAYTHKTHEKDAELAERDARRLKVGNVVVIAVTASAALIAPSINSTAAAWVAVVASITGLVFAVYQLSFDPSSDATRHRLAAKSYLELRNRYRRLLADVQSGDVYSAALRERRDSLARELDHLDRTAPQTSSAAYERARAALRGTEELTFSDDEYRHLLGGDA